MRILRKATKKAVSIYHAVDEEREDIPLRDRGFRVETSENNDEEEFLGETTPRGSGRDDTLRVGRIYKKRIFPSLKHKNNELECKTEGAFPANIFEDTLAVALASPSSQCRTDHEGPPRSFLRASSLSKEPKGQGRDTSYSARDPPDTMSVSSIFYDDSSLSDCDASHASDVDDTYYELETDAVVEDIFPDDAAFWSGSTTMVKTSYGEMTGATGKSIPTVDESNPGLDIFLKAESPRRDAVPDEHYGIISEDDNTNAETDISSLETTTTVRDESKGANPFDSSDDEDDKVKYENDYVYKNQSTANKNVMSMDEVKVIAKLMISGTRDHARTGSKVTQGGVFPDDIFWSEPESTTTDDLIDTESETSATNDDSASSNSDSFVQSNTIREEEIVAKSKLETKTVDSMDNNSLERLYTDSDEEDTSKDDSQSSEKKDISMQTYSDDGDDHFDDDDDDDDEEKEDIYYNESSSELHGEALSFNTTEKTVYSVKAIDHAYPSEKLLPSEQEEDSSVDGSEIGGCIQCSELEEKLMLLEAQHKTEMLERFLQDEEMMKNMKLMREYIEDLESGNLTMIAGLLESDQGRPTKSEIEKQLLMFDQELDYRSSSPTYKDDVPTDLKELLDENDRLSASLGMNQKNLYDGKKELETRIEELQKENERLSAEITKNEVRKAEVNVDFEVRLEELQSENDRLSAALSNGTVLNEKDDQDLKTRIILELEEERDLLKTKIESQQASVALMAEEEEQMKLKMRALEHELQHVLTNSQRALQESCNDESGNSKSISSNYFVDASEANLIKKLQYELEKSNAVRLSQEEAIAKLVVQVKDLSAKGASAILLQGAPKHQAAIREPAEPTDDLESKIRDLEMERNQLRSKCIFQQRTIEKMHQTSTTFWMPPIHEEAEFDTRTLKENNSDGTDEVELEETLAENESLKTKQTTTKSSHLQDTSNERDAHLKYLEGIIKSMSDSGSSDSEQESNSEGGSCEDDNGMDIHAPTGRAARWTDKIRRKSHELTTTILSASNPLSKKSKEEEEIRRGDGIFC